MDGFALLMGHLAGDFLLQNDFMAANKANPHPGPQPKDDAPVAGWRPAEVMAQEMCSVLESARQWQAYRQKRQYYRLGHTACLIHCTVYTLTVWAFTFQWMPLWGLLACLTSHFVIDRWRLARLWMLHVSGQSGFATGMLAPWSVVVIDQCFHLLILYLIALGAGR